jgi:hypothetical protein
MCTFWRKKGFCPLQYSFAFAKGRCTYAELALPLQYLYQSLQYLYQSPQV